MKPIEQRDYYTVTEAADVLGVRAETVRVWIEDKFIPAYRVGPKLWRLKKADVDARAAGRAPCDA